MPIARAKALKERIWRPALACATIAFGLLVLAASAHAAFPGKNGKIAFDVYNNSVYPRPYSINPDGSDLMQLNGGAGGADLTWSPDGTKIAFESAPCADVYTMNADGSGATQLTSSGSCSISNGMPSWSPDGTEIAFISDRDGNPEVYKMNSDGTNQTRLTNDAALERFPAWSPDGTKIAFQSSPNAQTTDSDIYVMNAVGTGATNLTNDPETDVTPSWSPDGSTILFVREVINGQIGTFKIFTMNADGTNAAPFPYEGSGFVAFPRFSPDGSKIVFIVRNGDNGFVYVMDVDPNSDGGHNITRIPNAPEGASRPDWQPIPINGYPRPKGATPFATYLAVAYKPCTSPNEQHGEPLAVLSCSPPQQASDFLTVGTLDANGEAAKAVGSVRYDVKPGTAANPADDADVKMTVSIKDVRLKDLSDYAGELQITSSRRITDKLSTPAPDGTTQAATTQDTPFSVTVPCAPTTADTTVGSLCAISTTADAVVPGQVSENARSNWVLGQIKVYDGGSDSDADTTADNTLFMDEGIFVP